MSSRYSQQKINDLIQIYSLTQCKLQTSQKRHIHYGSVCNTDRWHHQNEKISWLALGSAPVVFLPVTESSNVFQRRCVSQVKKKKLELSQFMQGQTSKFDLRTVEFITWGRSLTIALRRTSSPFTDHSSAWQQTNRSSRPHNWREPEECFVYPWWNELHF